MADVSLVKLSSMWLLLDRPDDKSTLVQVMAWCRQATSHYLGQCWPRSISPYGVTRPQWVKYNELCTYLLDLTEEKRSAQCAQSNYDFFIKLTSMWTFFSCVCSNIFWMITFVELFITDCTENCHFDNFRCQWWGFCQNDSVFPFQYMVIVGNTAVYCLYFSATKPMSH